MEVKLLSVTPDALNLLLRTKNTRLRHDSDPASWSDEQRAEHIAYMRDTIKSSWAFVDYVFEISGVTRAFTHQLVRTGHTPFAQESQRTVDVSGSPVLMPDAIGAYEERHYEATITPYPIRALWLSAVQSVKSAYSTLIQHGIPVQDARGILPTNTTTSIIGKFSLKTLHDMAKVRLCARTQGEYQDVFREMRRLVIETHPWVGDNRFIEVSCVGDGICAFPRWGKKECKFYGDWMDRTPHQNILHKVFWAERKQVAVPIAVNGKTM